MSVCLACASLMTAQELTHQQMRDSLRAAAEEMEKYPHNVDLRLRKAAWNVQLEQWSVAKEEYDRILGQLPDNLSALFYRAFVNEKLHRNSFARLDYEHLLMIVPNHFEARLGLALLNQKDNHLTEAMDQMNVLVEQYPDSAIAYAARAGMERERGMTELAIYDYGEAIRLENTNTDYLLNRADLYIEERKYREALQDLQRLQQLGVSRKALDPFYLRMKQ